MQRLASLPCRTFAAFVQDSSPAGIVLRHDVDRLPGNSLTFARLQHELGVRGSYYFRIVPASFQPQIMEQIARMGHEVGYHYEDVSCAAREMKNVKSKIKNEIDFEHLLLERAMESFEKNLARLRHYADIKTICMHGSPLSRWDSRLLWEKYDYRDYGIIGEPYFDIDFSRVAYYTDTGRRWDGAAVSVRDKPMRGQSAVGSRQSGREEGTGRKERGTGFPQFHSTVEIIRAIERGELPEQVMFTFHPQRWSDRTLPWVKEFILQNSKNVVKWGVVKIRK